MRPIRAVAVTALVLIAAGNAGAQIYAPESLARYFRVETHVERRAGGALVWGYIHNQTNLPAERMVVRIDALDAAGAITRSTTTWVAGLVPANNRAYFETRAPEGVEYRVTVLSFDWTGRGSGN